LKENEIAELDLICKLLDIPIINKDRKYWLVRTESGIYFDDFFFNSYIALGWDKVAEIKDLENLSEKDRNQKISELYPDEKKPGAIYNQIHKFTYDMHAGDIILIPSENSSEIAFGELVDDVVYPYEENITDLSEETSRQECKYNRRRKVTWIRVVKRDSLDPYLYKLMCSHAAISDASYYSNYIDRTLMPIFIKGDCIHLVYDVTTTENIPATNMISFISLTLNTIDVFNAITGANYDKNDIDLKLNVQSPGPIEFIGYALGGGLVLSAISQFFFGAKFKINLLNIANFETESKGLLSSILQFIKEANNHNEKIEHIQTELKKSKAQLKAYAPHEERKKENKVKKDENQITIEEIQKN